MPDRWIDGLKTVEDDGETKYRVSLDYPEIMPFMDNAESEQLAARAVPQEPDQGRRRTTSRCSKRRSRVRNEIATLLGYDSWAAYVVEKRMAKTRDAVDDFLRDLAAEASKRRRAPTSSGSSRPSTSTPATTHINIWDWWFYTNRLLKTEYAVDDFEVANYFPLRRLHRRPVPRHAGAARHPLRARARRPEVARRRAAPSTSTTPTATRAVRALLHGPLPAAEQVRPRRRLHARRRPHAARRHATSSRSAPSSPTSRSRPPTRRRCSATARS